MRPYILFREHNGHEDGTDGMDYSTNPRYKAHKHPYENTSFSKSMNVWLCVWFGCRVGGYLI